MRLNNRKLLTMTGRMGRFFYPVLLFALLFALSCSEEEGKELVTCPDGRFPVRWQVSSVGNLDVEQHSRLIINDDQALVNACTPVESGGAGESIGIWADYKDVNNTLPNIFKDTKLIYAHKEGGNPYSDWNYPGEDLYWSAGGDYYIRAFYPQGTIQPNIGESANATSFIVNYNTNFVQRDFLVAYNHVDSKTAQLDQPVELAFKHAMAALSFRFVPEEGIPSDDKLMSCWLENTSEVAETYFADVGVLIYGVGEKMTDEIIWAKGNQPALNQKIYYWEHGTGLAFTDKPYAYTDQQQSSSGAIFAGHAGRLLILPQASYGTVDFCFKTMRGGDHVYRLRIPENTGTEGPVIGKTQDAGGTDQPLRAPHGYLAGKRYTYIIKVGKTEMSLAVGVVDWNRFDSSHEIIF